MLTSFSWKEEQYKAYSLFMIYKIFYLSAAIAAIYLKMSIALRSDCCDDLDGQTDKLECPFIKYSYNAKRKTYKATVTIDKW